MTRHRARKKATRALMTELDVRYSIARRQILGIERSRPLRILSVATEWHSSHGGLSTFNRNLCVALADAGAKVTCLVPTTSQEERDDAAKGGVELMIAAQVLGGSDLEALMRRPALRESPDVIFGHGRVTGPAAQVLTQDHYPSSARVQFVHTAPDEIEWWKPDHKDDAAARAEQRMQVELALCRGASKVATVGPRLYDLYRRDLAPFSDVGQILRLDPGFDTGDWEPRVPPPGRPHQILILGRMEDSMIKGLDIAAEAIGRAIALRGSDAPDVELLIRGAPALQSSELRRSVIAWAKSSQLRVTVRSYSTDAELLQHDFGRSSLVLMPSRAEGFGLSGVEAIVAGVPVLVSGRSGLGMLLREALSQEEASRVVIPVSLDEAADVELWSRAIAAVLFDREAAFARSGQLRQVMAARLRWASAAAVILSNL